MEKDRKRGPPLGLDSSTGTWSGNEVVQSRVSSFENEENQLAPRYIFCSSVSIPVFDWLCEAKILDRNMAA